MTKLVKLRKFNQAGIEHQDQGTTAAESSSALLVHHPNVFTDHRIKLGDHGEVDATDASSSGDGVE